jgi:hypothetical protein
MDITAATVHRYNSYDLLIDLSISGALGFNSHISKTKQK